MDMPEICYAKSGNVRIAYQVTGDGTLDLVFVPGFISNLEAWWEEPEWGHLRSRLAAFSRLILFDKRGTGLSDAIAGIASLEDRMDDLRAVMDAVGSARAALFGFSEGAAMSMLFAATYPERTTALALYGAWAQNPSAKTIPDDEFERQLQEIDRNWGTGIRCLQRFAPSQIGDRDALRAWARWERRGASPSAAIALARMNREIDVRHVLPAIHVPTLVLHRSSDTIVSVEAGRYLAGSIPNAKLVELPGVDHWAPNVRDIDSLVDEIEQFLTGSRALLEPDRVLATVMFTDIVDSTKRAAALGDRDWRRLLDRHNEAVRQEIERFRGRTVKNLGDGFLATFDGPARAVRCAAAIADRMRPLGIQVRSGLHTGEIDLTPDDVAGIAVHIAARVAEKRARCWCQAQCVISLQVPVCDSGIAAGMCSGASRNRCACSRLNCKRRFDLRSWAKCPDGAFHADRTALGRNPKGHEEPKKGGLRTFGNPPQCSP
jgi:pimeloyl-ACP methyl ester carboxylesterase